MGLLASSDFALPRSVRCNTSEHCSIDSTRVSWRRTTRFRASPVQLAAARSVATQAMTVSTKLPRTLDYVAVGFTGSTRRRPGVSCVVFRLYKSCDTALTDLPVVSAQCGAVIVGNTQAGGQCDSSLRRATAWRTPNCSAEPAWRSGQGWRIVPDFKLCGGGVLRYVSRHAGL